MKRTQGKRMLAFLLAVIMVFAMIPAQVAFANGGGFDFQELLESAQAGGFTRNGGNTWDGFSIHSTLDGILLGAATDTILMTATGGSLALHLERGAAHDGILINIGSNGLDLEVDDVLRISLYALDNPGDIWVGLGGPGSSDPGSNPGGDAGAVFTTSSGPAVIMHTVGVAPEADTWLRVRGSNTIDFVVTNIEINPGDEPPPPPQPPARGTWQDVIDSDLTAFGGGATSGTAEAGGILVANRGTGGNDHNHGMGFNLAGLRALGNAGDSITIRGTALGEGAMQTQGLSANVSAGGMTDGSAFELVIPAATTLNVPGWLWADEPFFSLGTQAAGQNWNFRVTEILIGQFSILDLYIPPTDPIDPYALQGDHELIDVTALYVLYHLADNVAGHPFAVSGATVGDTGVVVVGDEYVTVNVNIRGGHNGFVINIDEIDNVLPGQVLTLTGRVQRNRVGGDGRIALYPGTGATEDGTRLTGTGNAIPARWTLTHTLTADCIAAGLRIHPNRWAGAEVIEVLISIDDMVISIPAGLDTADAEQALEIARLAVLADIASVSDPLEWNVAPAQVISYYFMADSAWATAHPNVERDIDIVVTAEADSNDLDVEVTLTIREGAMRPAVGVTKPNAVVVSDTLARDPMPDDPELILDVAVEILYPDFLEGLAIFNNTTEAQVIALIAAELGSEFAAVEIDVDLNITDACYDYEGEATLVVFLTLTMAGETANRELPEDGVIIIVIPTLIPSMFCLSHPDIQARLRPQTYLEGTTTEYPRAGYSLPGTAHGASVLTFGGGNRFPIEYREHPDGYTYLRFPDIAGRNVIISFMEAAGLQSPIGMGDTVHVRVTGRAVVAGADNTIQLTGHALGTVLQTVPLVQGEDFVLYGYVTRATGIELARFTVPGSGNVSVDIFNIQLAPSSLADAPLPIPHPAPRQYTQTEVNAMLEAARAAMAARIAELAPPLSPVYTAASLYTYLTTGFEFANVATDNRLAITGEDPNRVITGSVRLVLSAAFAVAPGVNNFIDVPVNVALLPIPGSPMELLELAMEEIEYALDGFTATNDTEEGDILEIIETVLDAALFADIELSISNFTVVAAIPGTAGSVTFGVALSLEGEDLAKPFTFVIAALAGGDNWVNATWEQVLASNIFRRRGGPDAGLSLATDGGLIRTGRGTGEHDHNDGIGFDLVRLFALQETAGDIVFTGTTAGDGYMAIQGIDGGIEDVPVVDRTFSITIPAGSIVAPAVAAGNWLWSAWGGYNIPVIATTSGNHWNFTLTGVTVGDTCILVLMGHEYGAEPGPGPGDDYDCDYCNDEGCDVCDPPVTHQPAPRPPAVGGGFAPVVRPAAPGAVVAPPAAPVAPAAAVTELATGETTATFTAANLNTIVAARSDLVIVTDYATITLPADAVAGIVAVGGNNFEVEVIVEATDTAVAVEVAITSGATVISNLRVPIRIQVAIDIAEMGVANHHRLAATTANPQLLGGSYDPATNYFTFETALAGEFVISYVDTLTRFTMQLGSPAISDLAGNSGGNRVMDVQPQIVNGRALVPVRFMGYALGAQVGFNDTTRQVTLTVDGRTLTMGIDGQIDANLRNLGMDVPAQIINDRTMVPVRFIGYFFDALVDFNDTTRVIEVIKM